VLGEANENNVIAEQGIEPGTLVYLSTPANPEKYKLIGEALIPIIQEKIKAKKEEELKIRQAAERALEQRSMMGRGGFNMGQFGQGGRGGQMGQGGGRGGNRQQGGIRDTAAMRRRMQNPQNQQGVRDTSARRRSNNQTD
jgi:hypothetical protein